jgi:hypothetical protein
MAPPLPRAPPPPRSVPTTSLAAAANRRTREVDNQYDLRIAMRTTHLRPVHCRGPTLAYFGNSQADKAATQPCNKHTMRRCQPLCDRLDNGTILMLLPLSL